MLILLKMIDITKKDALPIFLFVFNTTLHSAFGDVSNGSAVSIFPTISLMI